MHDHEGLPSTVGEAVDLLITHLSDATRATVAVLSREELVAGHALLGIDLQRFCGLWAGNTALFEDCLIWASTNLIDAEWEPASLYESLHPDEVARTILEALWEALHGWPVTEAIESASLCGYGNVMSRTGYERMPFYPEGVV